ncbi:hypothetical protein DACRYDRAFT_110958 [Dacryopinax primogenitus]|uniref:Uncharacterized protein n=1 Tax=Dacryopinax primogenitus (strain DJM 731) TaxID=1858805 RepID=M5FRX2_DACPD|nr:uncharacterized protein DACRYDRAFT_110958 [Dacryopinax primogenitus]EJT98513.1 hypothetical protein DACRYDRAFT_110958 [Dacryopinax primogenitus]
MQLSSFVAIPLLFLASQVVAQYGAPAPAPAPTSSSPAAAGASPSAQAAVTNGALCMVQLPFETTMVALLLTGSVIALM